MLLLKVSFSILKIEKLPKINYAKTCKILRVQDILSTSWENLVSRKLHSKLGSMQYEAKV